MEHNKNTIAAINNQHAIWIKFHDHSWRFHQSLKRPSRCGEGYFGSWGHASMAAAVVERF